MPVLREFPQNERLRCHVLETPTHSPSHNGAADIDVWDGPKRRTVTLGPWGSEQADKELSRIIAERKVSANTTHVAAARDITVNELFEAYKLHAERHYRTPTVNLVLLAASRLLISPVSNRRRISLQNSMLAYTSVQPVAG